MVFWIDTPVAVTNNLGLGYALNVSHRQFKVMKDENVAN